MKRTAVLLTVALCVLASRRPKLPGSLGVVAARIEIGMSQAEIIELIQTSYRQSEKNDLVRLYLNGRTQDGREFGAYCDWDFKALPSADQVGWAELDIDDDCGRDFIITLGPGGVVTGVRLESSNVWEELRYALSRGSRGTGWNGWPRLKTHENQSISSMLDD